MEIFSHELNRNKYCVIMSTTSTTTTTNATATRQQFLTIGTTLGQGMTTKGRSTRGTTHDRRSRKTKKGTSRSGQSKGSGSLSNQEILEDLNKTPVGLYTFVHYFSEFL